MRQCVCASPMVRITVPTKWLMRLMSVLLKKGGADPPRTDLIGYNSGHRNHRDRELYTSFHPDLGR